MTSPGITSRAAEVLDSLHDAWSWWRSEIVALLPDGVRRLLKSGTSVVVIDFGAEAVYLHRVADGTETLIAQLPRADLDAADLGAALAPEFAKPWFLRGSFVLRLPDKVALTRNLSLPLAARRNIASLLAIELDRQSPLDRAEIYHDYRVLGIDRQARRVDIVWRIVRRASVAPALELCRKAGIELAGVTFEGDQATPDGGNFPIARRALLLFRMRERLIAGMLVFIVALLVAVTAGAYLRNQSAADAFSGRVDEARVAAHASLHLQHEIDASQKRSALLLSERRHLTITRILAETTRVLPTGSWLTDFSSRDDEVHIQGYSNAASSLIALFDASPLFTSAEFRAPLVQAENPGQEQFDLVFKIRKGAR